MKRLALVLALALSACARHARVLEERPMKAQPGFTDLEESGVVIRIPDDLGPERFALVRVDQAPPRSIEEAVSYWTRSMREATTLATGEIPGGGFYGRFHHTVRTGSPSGTGMHKHMLEEIEEIASILPISKAAFVECSHSPVGPDERRDRALQVCASLRRR